jgi:hypothetical protein
MDTEEQNEKVTQSVRFDPALHTAITKLAKNEARPSFNNTVEWLLQTHPRVKKILEAETAGAGA